MGEFKQAQRGGTLILGSKSAQQVEGVLVRYALLLSFFILSCSSKPLKQEAPVVLTPVSTQVPDDFQPPVPRPLTNVGENIEAYFSPDGTRLIYRSEKRPEHMHPQLYELELATNKERRVTFQDGEV